MSFGYQDKADQSVAAQLADARAQRAKQNAGSVSTGKTVGGALGGIAGLVGAISTGQPELVGAGIAGGSALGGWAAGNGDNEGAAKAGSGLAEAAAKRYASQDAAGNGADALGTLGELDNIGQVA